MKTKLTLFSLRLFFLTCFLWAGMKGLNAQFPVTTQITLPVPHPLSLKDFSGANGQFSLKLKVQLHNIEISDRHFFVRLHLLNNHGLHIQTAPYAPIPPILLEGGFPTELSDLDLEPYFDPENLLFEGISKHQYLRQQQLPQGIYRIYFQVVESLSNKTINNPRAEQRIFPVVLGQPPLLIHPQDQAALPITEPPNILFQWMPRHLAIAGTAGHTTYRFRLVEMLDENISPYIQIHQDPPLLEVEQSATQLLYGIEYPPLLQNQLYAWRVEALVKNPDGSIRPVIQNPEKSQVRTFRYVPPCPPVPPLQIAQEDLQNVSLYWVKQEPHQEYTLSYRMHPKNRNWNKVTTSNSSMLLSDLAQGTVYQYKLEAKCAFAPAPFPQVLTDTTLTMEQAQKIGGCDAPEDLTPKSTIPLKKLLLQETFTTGAGRVHVTRLNSQHSEEGRYSGEGWMYFTPFLPPGAKLAVTFENIFINENRQHVGTEPVVAVRKKSRLDFFTQPTFIEDADPLVIEGQGSRVAGTVTRANFQAGKLVLSTEEGKEIHFKPRKDKPTMVTDDNNAQYVATTTGDIWGTLLSDQGKQEESEEEGEEEQAAAQDTGVQKSDKTSTDKPAPTVQDNFSLKGLEGVHFTISKQTQRFLDNFFQADESFKLYETLLIAGAEYTVPYKLVIVGETDIVRLESNAATKEMLREGKIVFIDPENPTQELTAQPNLTLKVAHDNPKKPKSLFALYKKSDKQKIIVGKIIIHAFEQKSKKLYIVPVWKELSWNREEAAKEFQKIYHPAGIAWEVSYLPVLKRVKGLRRKTVFSSQGLESSEIYSDDMFRVHKAFHKDLEEKEKEKEKQKQEKKEKQKQKQEKKEKQKQKQEKKEKQKQQQEKQEKQETKLDKEGYYLFVVPQGTNGKELGYWPKKRPYGYLFSDKIGGRNSYLLAKHIAHEVGHGAFNLFHTFSEANRYKISSGSTSNLMDYNLSLNSGTYREHQLFQYQWHQIHKPLNITGWIQEQEENKSIITDGDTGIHDYRSLVEHVFKNRATLKQGKDKKIDYKGSSSDSKWIKEWTIEGRDADDKINTIVAHIKIVQKGNFTKPPLVRRGIYFGKHKLYGKTNNVILYNTTASAITLKKYSVTNKRDININSTKDALKQLLDNPPTLFSYRSYSPSPLKSGSNPNIYPEIKNKFSIDIVENYILLSFYDESNVPVIILQIETETTNIPNKKDDQIGQWLTYLNIINPKLANLDTDPNLDWMKSISLEEPISAETLEKILNNQDGMNDRSDNSIYGKQRLKNWQDGDVYFGKDKGTPTFTGTEFEKEVKEEIFKELNNEGSFSSINTYDSEHFTWGKGFAVTGQLMEVINKLFEIEDKSYEQLFNNVGIKVVDNHFWVLDSKGAWKKDSPPSYEASDYIASNKQLLSFFIELAEKSDYYQDVIDVQYDVISDKGAGNYPAYILSKDKTAYADNWNHASVTVLCHLSHWAGYRWHEGTDRYKDTKGDLDKILYKYCYNTMIKYPVMRSGVALESNIYRWKSSYNILRNLEHWGNPKSTGKTKLNGTWNNHTISLQFKSDLAKKLRAVKTGTEKYVSNSKCILIKDGDSYIILTKDANSISYGDFKATE